MLEPSLAVATQDSTIAETTEIKSLKVPDFSLAKPDQDYPDQDYIDETLSHADFAPTDSFISRHIGASSLK